MIRVNMLSIANKVKGQGVLTAYEELINVLKNYSDKIEVYENKGINYDILHMHTVNVSSFIKCRLTKGTTLTYVHFLPNCLDGTIKLPKFILFIYSWWVRMCYLKSDYLVVVNEGYIDDLVKMGYDKNRIFYIPNVASDKFSVLDKKKLRKKYNIKENEFVVVSIGQLHKEKGVLDFIKIAKMNPDVKFIWVGGFNFGKFMEGYSEIKEVYDNPLSNLKFTGIVDRSIVNEYLNLSDIFLFPSFYESFGCVILEAACTNIPIVLRNLDVYKGLYEDNYIKCNNIDDFNNEIKKLKVDKMYYNLYKDKSINIKNKYNAKNIGKMWIELYEKIAK